MISLKNLPGTTSDLAGGPLCATEAPSPFIFSPRLARETKPILSDRLAFIKIASAIHIAASMYIVSSASALCHMYTHTTLHVWITDK